MTDTLNLDAIAERLFPQFAERSADLEASDSFVHENYAELKQARIFSAQVPTELGGGGVSHRQMCRFLRLLAHACPSTALALSMHQHLVAAAKKNYLSGKPGQALLEKVAGAELVLVSTGAGDWLESNGSAEKVDGGYRINAFKPFASGSPAGDVAVTSCAYDCPEDGPSVLHFPIPLKSEGVKMLDDWQVMGMRATGSQTMQFDNVFVPDAAIALKRQRGPFHPVFNVIVAAAMPLIMSVYVGVAEAAAEIARGKARKRTSDPLLPILVGEMENLLATAQMAGDAMVELADDLAFTPGFDLSSKVLSRKTICASHVIATAQKALEVAGGSGFQRSAGLERLLRDAHGAQFHPLPEKRQLSVTGRLAMGLDPV